MGDDDAGLLRTQRGEIRQYLSFGLRIERRCRLVQHQYRGVHQQRTRQSQALTLTPGQACTIGPCLLYTSVTHLSIS